MAVELFMITHKTERQILCNHSSILNIEVYLLSLKTTILCVSHGLCNFKCTQGQIYNNKSIREKTEEIYDLL